MDTVVLRRRGTLKKRFWSSQATPRGHQVGSRGEKLHESTGAVPSSTARLASIGRCSTRPTTFRSHRTWICGIMPGTAEVGLPMSEHALHRNRQGEDPARCGDRAGRRPVPVGAMCAFYRRLIVSHVEAGLRTRNVLPSEEVNRQRIIGWSYPTTSRRSRQAPEPTAGRCGPNVGVPHGNTVVDALQWIVSQRSVGTSEGGSSAGGAASRSDDQSPAEVVPVGAWPTRAPAVLPASRAMRAVTVVYPVSPGTPTYGEPRSGCPGTPSAHTWSASVYSALHWVVNAEAATAVPGAGDSGVGRRRESQILLVAAACKASRQSGRMRTSSRHGSRMLIPQERPKGTAGESQHCAGMSDCTARAATVRLPGGSLDWPMQVRGTAGPLLPPFMHAHAWQGSPQPQSE